MPFRYAATPMLAFWATLALAPSVQAQAGTLTGLVTNELGQPIAQAQIQVLGGAAGTGTLSNDQGRYRIDLPAGTYDLVVQHVAHAQKREDNISVGAGETTTHDIQMLTTAAELAGGGLVVTGKRAPIGAGERTIESASTTDLITGLEISERPTPKLTDHLLETPGVDVIEHGLQATNVVVRGFNNIFSGALHMLSDYRLAGVPSLRVNLTHFIPTTSEDLERMEVVLGPGSALYGPNTANGVVHMISKSPLEEQGTTVTLGSGVKGQDYPSAFRGAFRSAFLLDDSGDVGFKISGQYLDAEEWEFVDPVEAAGQQGFNSDPSACIADKMVRGLDMQEAELACARIGVRNFDIERYSVEARLDWQFGEDDGIVATYGRNSSTGIELTGLGAGQTDDWVSEFYQLRFTKDRLFAQTYVNQSDAGESFLLREGTILADESRLVVGQIQHGFELADGRQDFAYGFDYFATRPDSKRTIYGSYENDDEINEWGTYLQSTTELTDQLDFVGALRLDSHTVLPDDVWSPRAALVYNPNENHGIRLSYNRAFSTPTALNYFLDISGGVAPEPLGMLGYGTRAYGSGRTGWSVQAPDGTLRGMRSPFTPAALGGPPTLLPADATTMWQLLVGVLQAQGALTPGQAAALGALTPSNSDIVRLGLNPLTGDVAPVSALTLPDIEPTRESITQTYEVGWTGQIQDRVQIVADVYYTEKSDFVSPLLVQTPLLLFEQTSLEAYLTPFVGQPTAAAIAAGGSQIPLGVVSSESNGARGAELILSYRNVGEVDFWGGDIAVEVLLSEQWRLSGMYSHVTKDEFEIEDGTPITLNAPRNKGSLGLAYRNLADGLTASGRVRFTDSFPASSAGFVGEVDSYAVVDLTAGYEIPNTRATLQLSVSNLFDADYQSFVGVPEIGRFTMLAVRYELF